jgi:hypothetical protein
MKVVAQAWQFEVQQLLVNDLRLLCHGDVKVPVKEFGKNYVITVVLAFSDLELLYPLLDRPI